ncbi:MAG: NADH-quinone oxidoreductase subunit NuoE [Phycisphaeraceae bacterium]|nr:NADH-quinone oxidoreductase subunit NuoE [Phycisphaeraceae bacterium]
MAWIVKNSGGMTIERRETPYLDDALKQKLEAELLPRYPTRRAATLPVLHAVQDQHNWLPYQAIEEVAAFLGLQASEVLDTATFYEMFFLRPKGKYLIMLCQSISCELMGHNELMEKIERKLGIHAGETTEDGRFTLMHAECLGSCGTAPCGLINDRLHENITAENFERILDSLT